MTETPVKGRRSPLPTLLGCAALLTIFAITSHLAWSGKGPTFDEPEHFLGSLIQTTYLDFRCNPEDPPLWKYLASAGIHSDSLLIDRESPEYDGMLQYVGYWLKYTHNVMYEQHTTDLDALINAGRARMLLLGIALGALIAWWAWRLAGRLAALIACAAFCLDPNSLANGTLIKDDIAITLVFLALMASIWLLGERATIFRWFCVSVLMGVAFTTKFSGVLGVPLLGMALFIRAMLPQPWRILKFTANSRRHKLLAAAVMAVASGVLSFALIWTAYGFRFAPGADGKLFDVSGFMKICALRQSLIDHGAPLDVTNAQIDQWSQTWQPGLIPDLIQWANNHHVLPQAWLMGFFYTYSTSLTRTAYLCGEIRLTGWWYYFPVSMAVKTPPATIIALGLAAISLAFWKREKWNALKVLAILFAVIVPPLALRPLFQSGIRAELPTYSVLILIWLFAAGAGVVIGLTQARSSNVWTLAVTTICPVCYMLLAMRTNLDLGIRHVLPVYPFLFIFLGVAAARCRALWPRPATILILLFLFGLATETFAAFPNYIPFFNVAVGGPRAGWKLLGNSDLDWGQELPNLARWQRENQKPNQQLYLAYFGSADPRYYGLRYINLPGSYADPDQPAQPSALEPIFAISAPMRQGDFTDRKLRDYYEPFRHMEPFAVIGDEIYLFHAPPSWQQAETVP